MTPRRVGDAPVLAPTVDAAYVTDVVDAGAETVAEATTPGEARILVVEDDPHVRRTLAVLLGTRWRVEVADGGETAWTLARRSPPDLIISDVLMEEVDGIALLRRLRAHPATQAVPVILVSGRSGEQETIAGLEAGADDYLVKPFSMRELLVRVQTRLEITSMRRRNAQQDEALASLRRQTQWTEGLLDSLPVPLLMLEPSTARILFANRAAERLCGASLPRGVLLGTLGRFVTSDDSDGTGLSDAELAPSSPAESLHDRRLLWEIGGRSLSVLADSELRPAVHGHPAVSLLTLRDVTELVHTEHDLRQTLRMRDEFLSIASHELRTPLTTLHLQAEGLVRVLERTPDEVTPRLVRRLDSVRNQVRRLEQLVDNLLDVSRLIEGRLELHPSELDLGALATEATELLREQADRAGSALRLSAPKPVIGEWDRLRLAQVLANLLSNAIKFGRGGPIDIEVEGDEDTARIRVRDRGVGISVSEQARIFERFARATSERDYPGLGLGLWITRQIVVACGGRIEVDSRPGEGSTFTVELPRRKP